ncbi:OadG family protein [Agaribacterium haliotis]|uniref:OadG family protein n=1 Tax=Agaribacterium haliotis TaxID=2013869 RepID=UPI000BB56801|nr:OadG family transporter subunit [Agaribacterium haliotis]
MEADLIQQGVDLMLFGMGTVFVFLSVLVVSTTLMSNVVTRFFPEAEVPEPGPTAPAANAGAAKVDARTLAVIQEAIYQHRAKTK